MIAVVDAPVALMWAQAPGTDPRIKSACELVPLLSDRVAPDLLAHEVAQVIHVKRPQDFGADPDARTTALQDLLEMVLLEPPDVSAAGRLAEEHGISAYDAAYLELAGRRDCPLVTEDARLRRAGGIGVADALAKLR